MMMMMKESLAKKVSFIHSSIMRKAHQHHHNKWETSNEGLSSPWIGNFQRMFLCRPYEKEGREGGDDEIPGPIKFHPFTHSSMMRKAFIHRIISIE
jgi:hypothetical protein